jgi:hypothetical protein
MPGVLATIIEVMRAGVILIGQVQPPSRMMFYKTF